MRILFLHEVNYLTKPIFEMHEVPEAFVNMGHEVSFVHFPEGQTWKESLDQKSIQWIRGRVERNTNLRLITPRVLGGSIIGRIVHVCSFYIQFTKILSQVKPDVVFSYSVPTSGWQALIACRKRGIPYLFRALDASSRIRNTPFSKVVEFLEKYVYRNADWVSANNPAMLEYVTSHGASPKRSSVDYPPLDVEKFQSSQAARTRVRSRLGLSEDARVLVYMGSFFYFSGLPDVIRSFGQIRGKKDFLVLIGMGEEKDELESIVKALHLEKFVIFAGYVEFSELPAYFSAADVAINSFIPSTVSDVALPNKVLQYMASGLPVVSTNLRGLVTTFGDSRDGLIFVEEPRLVVPQALRLLSDEQGLGHLGRGNKSIVSRVFEKKSTLNTLQDRAESLLDLRP